MKKYLILVVVSLCFLGQGAAQLKFKIGYNLGFADADVNNQIVEEFNASFDNSNIRLENTLDELGIMHGVDVGLRYYFDQQSIELSWSTLSRERSVLGEVLSGGVFRKTLIYRLNTLVFSYNVHINKINLGLGLGRNVAAVREEVSNEEFTRSRGDQLVFKGHVGFGFRGNEAVRFELRPYIQIPFNRISLDNLADSLELQNSQERREGFPIIGLSFLFFNG